MRIVIVGAGLTGILTAYLLKDKFDVIVYESRSSLNLTAPAFWLFKHIPNISMNEQRLLGILPSSKEQYLQKVYGKVIPATFRWEGAKVSTVWDYNLDEIVPKVLPLVQFNTKMIKVKLYEKIIELERNGKMFEDRYDLLISTTPFPVLAKSLNISVNNLEYVPIGVRIERAKLDTDVNTQIYISDICVSAYRITYVAQSRTIYAEYSLSNPFNRYKKYDMIMTPGRVLRSKDIEKYIPFLEENDIHLLGRYARWNPDFLVENAYDYVQEKILKEL